MPQVTDTETGTRITVELGDRAYDVLVGEGLLASAGTQIAALPKSLGRHCALITDHTVDALYSEPVVTSLRAAGIEAEVFPVPPGEASKSMDAVTDLCRKLLRAGFDRKSFVVALGGGVVGDLAGFVAAIFQRGVPYVQIPTTVVSQVDSSVGGKTGVNTPEGKNLIGAFHQPRLVLADVTTLSSLPAREYNEGFAEIIKHAAIRDAAMLDVIRAQGLSRENLTPLIARNVAIKAAVVEEDEKETTGVRAHLNFGHTIGHGIEAAAGYGRLLHGEAISLGLAAAARLSHQIEGLPQADVDALIDLLKAYHLPVTLDDDITTESILSAMKTDKKFEAGQIRFVLLRTLGDAVLSNKLSHESIISEIGSLR